MNKFEHMIDRFQFLIDIEYDQKRVERAVKRAVRGSSQKNPKTVSGKETLR